MNSQGTIALCCSSLVVQVGQLSAARQAGRAARSAGTGSSGQPGEAWPHIHQTWPDLEYQVIALVELAVKQLHTDTGHSRNELFMEQNQAACSCNTI